MNKFVAFASESRLHALVCSSVTVLLTACGGGTDGAPSAQAAQPDRHLAAVSIVNGAAAQDGTAAASAQDQFALKGYTDANAPAEAGVVTGTTDSMQNATVGALAPQEASITAPSTTYKYYVSPTGNDSASGTSSAPWKTLARAARAAKPNTTIFVAPGTYTGGFKTTASGTSTARIYWVSTTRHGAKIVPAASSPNNTAWDNRGNYVSIIGFEVDGTRHQSGTRWTLGIYNGGSYDMIAHNRVHHIATGVTCGSAGGSAIGVDSYFGGVKSDVYGNLVHDIGPAGCRYVQGIYISTSGTVKNNVVYRVAEGAIHLWHDARNVIISNNTVTTSNTGIIVGGGDFYKTSGPNDYTMVYNNIVYDNKMGISEQGKTGRNNQYRNNLVYQNPTYNFRLFNSLQHYNTVSSNPLFVAYSRTGTPNLKITSSSPAVGRGVSTHAPTTDYADRPRNSTTGFDIGAYQH